MKVVDILMSIIEHQYMRTTLRINDALLKAAKKKALEEGITLTALMENALRKEIARKAARGENKYPKKIPSQKGLGLKAGIDLSDNAALLDTMDGDE